MIENLVAIDLPPGLHNNGTTYQAKNRWFLGNLVRFFQGNKQPIGGWVTRSLSGAQIQGVPNAAISWQLNDGTAWLAIGTSTNLYVVSSSNVVSDITPNNGGYYNPPYTWQLETFGAYLLAVINTGVYVGASNVFAWTGTPSQAASQLALADATTGYVNLPLASYGVCATPERFAVLLRGSDTPTHTLRPANRVNA